MGRPTGLKPRPIATEGVQRFCKASSPVAAVAGTHGTSSLAVIRAHGPRPCKSLGRWSPTMAPVTQLYQRSIVLFHRLFQPGRCSLMASQSTVMAFFM